MRKTRLVLWVIAGVVVCVLVVGAGVTAWFFMSAFESADSDEAAADRAFAEVRQRMGPAPPIIEITGETASLTRQPPVESTGREIQHLQMLTWSRTGGKLSRITLPWWLLRMSEGPVNLTADGNRGITAAQSIVTAEEIERYGPAILVEHGEPDGSRVLVWTE